MAQLIQMRQRIKAIETIKKITHAMRLIAMSTNLRLRAKKNYIDQYMHELSTLFSTLYHSQEKWNHPLLTPHHTDTDNSLLILVGSQKGLCGNFNTELYAFFEKELLKHNRQQLQIITVGKKITEYIQKKYTITKEFNEFSINSLQKITHMLVSYIVDPENHVSSVTVYNNYSKTFFVQKPQSTMLIPLSTIAQQYAPSSLTEYIWEQPVDEIMTFLIEEILQSTLYYLLFQSLMAEQASRFIAMNNSTRNAGTLLDSMRLNYNKLRQSKITRELTDLAGSFF